MTESGRACRKTGRTNRDPESAFDVELTRDTVQIRFQGRVVRTLTGPDAEDVRAVINDPDQLQRVVARKAGSFKRRGER